jgi:hypothetical protein
MQVFSLYMFWNDSSSSFKLTYEISVKSLIASILVLGGAIRFLSTFSTRSVWKTYPKGIQDRKVYRVFRHCLIKVCLIA